MLIIEHVKVDIADFTKSINTCHSTEMKTLLYVFDLYDLGQGWILISL